MRSGICFSDSTRTTRLSQTVRLKINNTYSTDAGFHCLLCKVFYFKQLGCDFREGNITAEFFSCSFCLSPSNFIIREGRPTFISNTESDFSLNCPFKSPPAFMRSLQYESLINGFCCRSEACRCDRQPLRQRHPVSSYRAAPRDHVLALSRHLRYERGQTG